MHVKNEIFPSDPAQIQELLQPGPDGPIFMINLLKFKDKAEYEDGRETSLSGRMAYEIYAEAVTALLPNYSGKAIFAANTTFLAVGQADELWDEIAIAMYESRGDLLRMSMSEEWQQIAVHRNAGLAGQLNIESVLPEGAELSFELSVSGE